MAVGVLGWVGRALDVGASIAALFKRDERTNVRVKTTPLARLEWSSVCLHRVTRELSIIIGNAGDETSVADGIECFRIEASLVFYSHDWC